MKKIIVILFFSFLCVTPVFAHTLKIDGNIGVNLHVDPDDTPIAGRESKFFVDIQDKSGRFNPNNPSNCDCKLIISQKDTVLKTLLVTVGGSYAQLRFTFPTAGTYTVVVEGKPLGQGVAFQTFRTKFEYFVKSGSSEESSVQTDQNALRGYAPYVALVIGLVIITMFLL